jgi:integrase
MAAEHYRALLRSTDGPFRRVLVFQKFTGCRPIEMRKIKWAYVDLERCIVTLADHKTKKKTGRPRIIPLCPVVVKLLRFLERNRPRDPLEGLRSIVANGPVHSKEYRRLVRAAGFKVHDIYQLSARAGVTKRRVGRIGSEGYWVWELQRPGDVGLFRYRNRKGYYSKLWVPRVGLIQKKLGDTLDEARVKLAELKAEYAPLIDEPVPSEWRQSEYVFLNAEGTPWTKAALSNRMQRARKVAGLKSNVALYTLRHGFTVAGIKKNVHMKVLAEILGHKGVAMVDKVYGSIGGDVDLLHDGLQQIFDPRANGKGGER